MCNTDTFYSGGGRTLDEETGKMRQATDQEKSTYGLGFERAKLIGNPIAIIAGESWRSILLNASDC